MRFGAQRFALWLDWGDPCVPLGSKNDQVRTPHVLLGVKSLAQARRTLKARGARLKKTPSGLFDCLEDPEGNMIMLFEEPSGSAFDPHVRRGLDHLERMEAFRDQIDARMREAGVRGFETPEARASFFDAHGLEWPRIPRRGSTPKRPSVRRRVFGT